MKGKKHKPEQILQKLREAGSKWARYQPKYKDATLVTRPKIHRSTKQQCPAYHTLTTAL